MPPDSVFDAAELAAGLERGRDGAYRLVSAPKEGTILTAITDAAAWARTAAQTGASFDDALAAAVDGARSAVERSPELLPVLKEAGVVDAGAEGLYVLLAGMLRTLRGEPLNIDIDGGAIDSRWLAARQRLHEHDAVGYCTEFVLSEPRVDAAELRRQLGEMGTSVLVTGEGATMRVHIHADDPQPVFAYARTVADVSQEKADDMQAQMNTLAGNINGAASASAALGVVAVAVGDGIEELMRSLGAIVVRGGQTMNPSAGDLARAIDGTRAARVIVLPDNKNIVLAARQAAEAARAEVSVLPALSIPAGIAALVALNPEEPFESNVSSMEKAVEAISSAEITRAVRTTTIEGRAIREGQAIGIIDGELTIVEDDIDDAASAAVRKMIGGRDIPLVTLYYGEEIDEARAGALADEIRATHSCEVEVVRGGQPQYAYLIGVE